MSFITAPGIEGQLYVPDEMPGRARKHNCKDCASCMVCNDDKCAMCLNQQSCEKNKTEQETGMEGYQHGIDLF